MDVVRVSMEIELYFVNRGKRVRASDVEDRIFQRMDVWEETMNKIMASMFLVLCTVTSNMTTYNDFFVSSSGGIVMTIVVALKPNIALLWSPIVMRSDGSSRIG